MVELPHGEVVDEPPVIPSIPADIDAAIGTQVHEPGIVGIDPKSVEVGVDVSADIFEALPPSSDLMNREWRLNSRSSFEGSTKMSA